MAVPSTSNSYLPSMHCGRRMTNPDRSCKSRTELRMANFGYSEVSIYKYALKPKSLKIIKGFSV